MTSNISFTWTLICFIRSVIFYVSFALVSLLFFPLMIFSTLLFPFRITHYVSRAFCKSVTLLATLICGIRYRIYGQEHLLDTPVVFMPNHQSAWEIFCLFMRLPPHVYVLKKELFRIPIFGWGLRLSRPIAINRSKGHAALKYLIKEGQKRIQEGYSISIFPEGTRQAPGVLGPFHSGGALLAHKTAVPVIPIAHNAGDFWPARSFIKYPGMIEIHIQKPIFPENLSAAQINSLAYESIRDTMKTIQFHNKALHDGR